MIKVRSLLCLLSALSGLATLPMCTPASAATQHIENTASLNFTRAGMAQSVTSNTTTLDFDRKMWPTSLKFYRMPAHFDYSEQTCVAGPSPAIHGAPIDAAMLAAMPEDDGATDHSLGIVLTSPASNRNPLVRETETITASASTGESGNVILTETGPDTGVFAAGLSSTSPTGHAQACLTVFPSGTQFTVNFMGDSDSMPSTDDILIDPYGHVFDSVTGAPVNGASVHIINDATGQLAAVYGEDGVTVYPS